MHPLISSSKSQSGHDMLLPQKRTTFGAHINIVIVVANHRHKSYDAVVDCFHFSVGETCSSVEVAFMFNAIETPT